MQRNTVANLSSFFAHMDRLLDGAGQAMTMHMKPSAKL